MGIARGTAREALSVARCLAWYPMGVLDAALRTGKPCGEPALDTPVLLVHGFGHNRSGWFVVERKLRDAGFTSVHTLNYNPVRDDVPTLAAHLGWRIDRLRELTGASKVHVVGHSLGGIMLRWYVQELGGDEVVDTAITVCTPHEGTWVAGVIPGRTARELVPGSWVIRRLYDRAQPMSVRWVAYYSNVDALVQPARSAMLLHPALRATNVLAKDLGHLSVLLSPKIAASIVEELCRSVERDVEPLDAAQQHAG